MTHKAKQITQNEFKCECGFGPRSSVIEVLEHIKKERARENASGNNVSGQS